VGTSVGPTLGVLDGGCVGGLEIVGDVLGEFLQFPHDLGHSSNRSENGQRSDGLPRAQEQNLKLSTSFTNTFTVVSTHPVGASDGFGEGCRVGALLGSETGPFVGFLVGEEVGFSTGDAEGDELGASHRPQVALQLALTSTCSSHLSSVLNRFGHSQDFDASIFLI
jgi:hypothetical protein